MGKVYFDPDVNVSTVKTDCELPEGSNQKQNAGPQNKLKGHKHPYKHNAVNGKQEIEELDKRWYQLVR